MYTAAAPSGGDDGPALQATINQAISDVQNGVTGKAEIRLKKGATYRLGARADRYDSLDFRTQNLSKPDIRCIDFNGQNAKLSISPVASGIYVGKCTDCTFRNFKITASEDAGSQGVVVVVHPSTGSDAPYVDVKVHADFPIFSIPENYIDLRVIEPGKPIIAILHEYDSGTLKNRLTNDYGLLGKSERKVQPYFFIKSASIIDPTERVMRLFLASDATGEDSTERWQEALLAQIVPDQTVAEFIRFYPDLERRTHLKAQEAIAAQQWRENPELSEEFFVGNSGRIMFTELSSNILIQNVVVTNYQGSGLQFSGNMGPITVDNVDIRPEADGHLLSIASDGMHGNNNRIGPVIKNSLIENADDDSINMSSAPYYAVSVSADRMSAELSSSKRPFPVLAGDRFGLHDSTTWAKKGEYVVASAKVLSPLRYSVTFTKALPSDVALQSSPSPLSFVNYNMSNSGLVVTNNVFLSNMRGGVITRSSATIKNNHFITLGNAAVLYSTSNENPRGFIGDGKEVLVEGNTVIDSNNGLLDIGRGVSPKQSVSTAPVTVRNNTVIGPHNWVAWRVAKGMDSKVVSSNNKIYTSGDESYEQLIRDPKWNKPATVIRENAAKLEARKFSSSPLAPLAERFVQTFFFGQSPVAASCTLTASPSTVAPGSPVRLSWKTTNAANGVISDGSTAATVTSKTTVGTKPAVVTTGVTTSTGVGAMLPIGKGSITVSPLVTTTYTATVVGAKGGTATCSTEVRVKGKSKLPPQVTKPRPVSGVTGRDGSATMSWNSKALQFDVYLSTSPALNATTYKGTVTEKEYTPAKALLPKTKYYWRVDAGNKYGTTTGAVWNFTTK